MTDAEKLELAGKAAHKLWVQAHRFPEAWRDIGARIQVEEFMRAFGREPPKVRYDGERWVAASP